MDSVDFGARAFRALVGREAKVQPLVAAGVMALRDGWAPVTVGCRSWSQQPHSSGSRSYPNAGRRTPAVAGRSRDR